MALDSIWKYVIYIHTYIHEHMHMIHSAAHYVHGYVWSPIFTIVCRFTYTYMKCGNCRHIPMCVLRCVWVSTCSIYVYDCELTLVFSRCTVCISNFYCRRSCICPGRWTRCVHISVYVLNSREHVHKWRHRSKTTARHRFIAYLIYSTIFLFVYNVIHS